MNALQDLAARLARTSAELERSFDTGRQLDEWLPRLQNQLRHAGAVQPSADEQHAALAAFWHEGRLDSFRALRLVCFALADMAPGVATPQRLIDDTPRLERLLSAVDAWQAEPRRFRRCFQGLMRGYFDVDGMVPDAPASLRANAERLRRFLARQLPCLSAPGANPAWVEAVQAHPALFGPSPAEHLAAMGDALFVTHGQSSPGLLQVLGVSPRSWLVRAVVQARVRAACQLGDDAFLQSLGGMLDLLGSQPAAREQGVAALLARHAALRVRQVHRGLFNAGVLCFGSPAGEAGRLRWRHAGDAACEEAEGWVRSELLEAFFAAFDIGDASRARRAAYWRRHLPAMDDLHLALTPSALDRLKALAQPVALLERKLDGRVQDLHDPPANPAALLMHIGPATLVEFADAGMPMHAYGGTLPFDLNAPLTSADPAPNTLRHPSRALALPHRDGIQGWTTWEARFDAQLKRQFGIEAGQQRTRTGREHVDLGIAAPASLPDLALGSGPMEEFEPSAQAGLSAHWQTAEAGAVAFGMAELAVFARVHGLAVEDLGREGGPVVVYTDDADKGVAWVLQRWGFEYEPGRGWVRPTRLP